MNVYQNMLLQERIDMLRTRVEAIQKSDNGFPLLENIGYLFLQCSFFSHAEDEINSLSEIDNICNNALLRGKQRPSNPKLYLYTPIRNYFFRQCKELPVDRSIQFSRWFYQNKSILEQICDRYTGVEEILGYPMFEEELDQCPIPIGGNIVTCTSDLITKVEYFISDRIVWMNAICDFFIEQLALGDIDEPPEVRKKFYEWLRVIKIMWSFECYFASPCYEGEDSQFEDRIQTLLQSKKLIELVHEGNERANFLEESEHNRTQDLKINWGPQKLLDRFYLDDLMEIQHGEFKFDFTNPPKFTQD